MKKLDMIYVPSGAALEYAPLAVNLYRGCSHACRYCYAPACLHMTREDFAKPEARKDILVRLKGDAANIAGDPRPILLCFTSDPYQPLEALACVTKEALHILGDYRLQARVLTKNGALAQRDFGLMKAYGVEFGETICFDSERMRQDWEPGAGTIASRMKALAEAHRLGIKTWVSVEPVISPPAALRAMSLISQYVDCFKVGKLNHMPAVEKDIDWRAFLRSTLELFDNSLCGYYIKDALWSFADEAIKARWPKERA